MISRFFDKIAEVVLNELKFARVMSGGCVLISIAYFFTLSDSRAWGAEKIAIYVAAVLFLALFLSLYKVKYMKTHAYHSLHFTMSVVALVNIYHMYLSHLSYYHAYEFLVYYILSIVFIVRKDFMLQFVLALALLVTLVLFLLPDYNMPVYDFALTYLVVTFLSIARLYSRITLEEKLLAREKALESHTRDLESFAHISSHDMREPLRTIISYQQLIKKRYANQLDESAHEYIDYANSAAKNLSQLVNDILSYSTLSNHSLKLQRIEPETVLNEIMKDMQVLIAERKAQIIFESLHPLKADASLFKSVLVNLIANGIKYNRSEVPIITISTYPQNNRIILCITDNGIGIAEEYQQVVWERFKRLHNRSDYNGTGLGLSIVKRAVELHGGNIRLTSEPDKGTSFYIDLPLAA